MRGKDEVKVSEEVWFRITPAYAGKSDNQPVAPSLPEDHPRVCGEKATCGCCIWPYPGSPPRMRGKAWTPRPPSARRGDHPRVCGEKVFLIMPGISCSGSPPRMRGKEDYNRSISGNFRITPAYAGKRSKHTKRSARKQDHPRVCGEKISPNPSTAISLGSPPRMRGKAVGNFLGDGRGRITPAYAGKRLKRSRSTVPPVAIVPLFPSVCNKPVVSDGSPAGRDAPLFLPAENAVPASPAYNLRSL